MVNKIYKRTVGAGTKHESISYYIIKNNKVMFFKSMKSALKEARK
jgi:hypothetical protein